jgi:outer membrane lipoprotein-sorting protein
MKRISIKVIIALFSIIILTRGVYPDTLPDYSEILTRAMNVNSGLETFRAKINIRTVILGMTIPMRGYVYYQHPDNVRLSLPSVPKTLMERRSIFQDAIPRSLNPKDYHGRVTGLESLGGGVECYLIELIPRNDPTITKINLWVDSTHYLVHKSIITKQDNSTILSIQNYTRQNQYILPEKQYVRFQLPKFGMEARIDFKKFDLHFPFEGDKNNEENINTDKDFD